jgi:aminopeptidase N
MFKKLLLIAALAFVSLSLSKTSNAQLLKQKTRFSRFDSLRGTLNQFRDCYDVRYYALDVTIDTLRKRVVGNVNIVFDVLRDFKVMQVDLYTDYLIEKVVVNNVNIRFSRDSNHLFLDMPAMQRKGTTNNVSIFYYGKPKKAKMAPWDGGFVWSRDSQGKPWIGVAVQGIGASLWWPNKDHQSDEPDSMAINVTVPADLTEVSNGKLMKASRVKGTGLARYEWKVHYPINNYNVTLNIGDYTLLVDTFTTINFKKLPLDYYVLRENADKAKEQFKQVKPMLECFERYFGEYPYVKDGFKLVETPYLGMEHQSCVAYGNGYKNGYMGRDLSGTGEGLKFDYIIIHEAAHEWWGNAITTKDIADMWVHEGFAQYAEAIYLECMYGKESAFKYLDGLKGNVKNDKPIIGPYFVNQEGSADMYPKGALLLHTIRNVLHDDDLWFKTLKELNLAFRHKTVETGDIEKFMSEKLHLDLSKIFDQYLRFKDIPKLEYKLAQKGGNVELQYRWVANVSFFDMPIKVTTHRGVYEFIEPDIEWKTLILNNMQVKDFFIDEGFYIKTVKLK